MPAAGGDRPAWLRRNLVPEVDSATVAANRVTVSTRRCLSASPPASQPGYSASRSASMRSLATARETVLLTVPRLTPSTSATSASVMSS